MKLREIECFFGTIEDGDKLKGKYFMSVVKPATLYESKYWVVNNIIEQSKSVVEIKLILKWMCRMTR